MSAVFGGGKAKFFVEGDFAHGGGVKLQLTSPNGTLIDVPNSSLTANSMFEVDLPPGQVTATPTRTLATAKVISDVTSAHPVIVTATSHGYSNGDLVYIEGVVGTTEINGLDFVIGDVTTHTFSLQGVNGLTYTAYVSDGTVQKVTQALAVKAYLVEQPE